MKQRRRVYSVKERNIALKLIGDCDTISVEILAAIRKRLKAPSLNRGTIERWQCEGRAKSNQVNLDFDPDQLLADMPSMDGFWRDDEIDALMNLKDIADLVEGSLDEKEGDRLTGNRRKQIKPVLYVDEVATFEDAMAATGLLNRGQALLEICRFYLENHKQ